jgi:L-seryl-tRNA(Ser) seleniumtransferase
MSSTIYDQLGTKPVINALGIYTDLGGSILSPAVWSAMEQANQSFVSMVDLLDKTGMLIADLVGAEAARVTPGAAAAIALGTAACLTGTDGTRMELLPETGGMKSEVLIQRRHRYKYDRCARMVGARLVEVGDEAGTTRAQFEAALGPQTAAILFPAHLGAAPGTIPLAEVAAIARPGGVPTLVDAAYMNYPVEIMSSFTAAGADLVCFSAKYFGGPNAGGFICGRPDLIEAVAGVDFTRFESGRYRIYGRPFKLDRQIVVGVVAALREWLSMDHAARFAGYRRMVDTMSEALSSVRGLEFTPLCFTMQETLEPEPVNCLRVRIGPATGTTAQAVAEALHAGNPGVLVHLDGDALIVDVEVLRPGDDAYIAEQLRRILA